MSNQGFTIEQTAAALGISTRTVRRKIKEGKLRAELVSGRFGDEYRVLDIPATTKKEKPKDEPLDINPSQAMDIIQRLQQDNLQLGVELGRYQERIIHLEEQVKLLTAGRQPWWRRLFRR